MENISQAIKDAAIKYTRKGWRLTPVQFKQKNPIWFDWGNKPVTDPTTAEMVWNDGLQYRRPPWPKRWNH